MFIILNWIELAHILPVMNEDGTTMIFEAHAEAEKYADNLNFNWQIVEI